MPTIDNYAVFGHPISHSKSPLIHHLFAEQTGQQLSYSAHDVPAEVFKAQTDEFFKRGGKGLNCTVPLKELAWEYADHLSDRARISKAVNTLTLQADGGILGDNTDGVGLVNDLTRNHQLELFGKRLLILGAGGATRGIMAPLLACQPSQIMIANRTVSKAETIVSEFTGSNNLSSCNYADLPGQQFDLIINATSASLSNQLPALPDTLLAKSGCCYDLAYSNQPTAFVVWGQTQHAAKSLDGLGMLVEQAAEAFNIWRGIRPDTLPIITLLEQARQTSRLPT
ncbi:MAG: shikimate dehydrogenase [Methylomonas sp.]|nr:MAG: shikimate dehydrogenase [Methylomonas sp.]